MSAESLFKQLSTIILWLILCFLQSQGEITMLNAETTSTSITISWAFPQTLENNLTVFRILTRYVGPCTATVPQLRNISINRNLRTTLIDSLEEFSTYNITIDGISSESMVLYSANTSADTNATRPPSPGNLRATQVTWVVVSLEWDEIPCLERNANIDQYRIFGYRGNNIRTTPEILGTAISQDTIHTATGLRPDTEYSFFVYAVYYDDNNRGPYQGGHSNTLTLLTQRILVMIDLIQVEPRPNGISLIWSSRVEPEGVNLLQYEIVARYIGPCGVDSFSEKQITITNPLEAEYHLQDLEELSSYEVIVTAVAEYGQENSTNATITTLGVGQTAAIFISSIEAGSNDITLMWTTHVEPNCRDIIQYEIEVLYLGPCDANTFNVKKINITNSSSTDYHVHDLEDSSNYEVTITVVLGDGKLNSTTASITTLGELGGSPSITSVLSNPTSIGIAWEVPSDACIDSYEVTAAYAGPCTESALPESHHLDIISSETSFSAEVHDLRPFSIYNVSVIAVNTLKRNSITIALRTGPSIPGSPTSIQLESTSQTTADVSWMHDCVDKHANIIAYMITYAPTNTFPEEAEVRNVSATATHYQLNGLEPGLQYTVQVFAVSEHIGPGMKSEPITIMTRLIAEATDGQIEVSNTSNLFSNSSVVIALIIVAAILVLGILAVVVICIGVIGAVFWKRNSRKVVVSGPDHSMELEECSAYGTSQKTLENFHESDRQSSYQAYQTLQSIENAVYEKIKPLQNNSGHNALARQNRDEYDSLVRTGGTVGQSTGDYEENFTMLVHSPPSYSP